jgi:hypothetical protein
MLHGRHDCARAFEVGPIFSAEAAGKPREELKKTIAAQTSGRITVGDARRVEFR